MIAISSTAGRLCRRKRIPSAITSFAPDDG
jgi:hypothetical protein